MALSKLELLFGESDPEIDITSDVEVREFFLAELGSRSRDREDMDEMRAAVRAALAAQILEEEPAGVWETAQRLEAAGLDRIDVIEQMTMVLLAALRRTFDSEAPFSEDEYRDDLAALPLPTIPVVLGELHRFAELQGASRERAVEAVCEWVGATSPLAMMTVERIVEHEIALGVLLWELPGGRVVHLPTLTEGLTFTHRLDRVEQELNAFVGIGRDLAAFSGRDELTTPDGSPVGVESLAAEQVAWFGPDGWLSGFSGDAETSDVETLVAVSVDADGVVLVAATPTDLDDDSAIVELVGHTVAELLADVPVTLEEVVLAVALADPDAFAVARRPLTELCEAAGLEVRGTDVASDEAQWAEQAHRERMSRIEAVVGEEDSPLAAEYVEALSTHDDPIAVRRALVGMVARQETAVPIAVLDELIEADDPSEDEVATARIIASAAIDAAGDEVQQMCAQWLAGMVEERAGDARAASEHFESALAASHGFGFLLDRGGWYAFERGDAVTALARWTELEDPDPIEVATCRRFIASPGAKLGRNDPCWCGSGRKYKTCHLAGTEQHPLADRHQWLYRKAVGFLRRHGQAPRDLVYDLCEELAVDPDDAMSLSEAFNDPIVFDAALAEAELFEEFVAARAGLLPVDEADLARRWLAVPRQIHELPTGDLVCGRLVPIDLEGERHEFLPGAFIVSPEERDEVETLCEETDAHELCRWLRERRASTHTFDE